MEFQAFPKIPRLNRDIIITEKIDGTNAAVVVAEGGLVYAQSRRRIITPESDNFGFAGWVNENEDTLAEQLGAGYHYGEWYGLGIQRGYGLTERRFALFNPDRYKSVSHPRVDVVPVLYHGRFSQANINAAANVLREVGSVLVPGYRNPEGIIIFHTAGRHTYKVLLEGDEIPKGVAT